MAATHEFTAIPLKFNPNDVESHQLFVRESVSKATNRQKPNGRTLYVLNVPPYATKEALHEAFSAVGSVEQVTLQEKPTSKESTPLDESARNQFTFQVAYVVFEKPSSLKALLKSKMINALNANGTLLTGMQKWTKAYYQQLPDRVAMQQEIDRYMESYDETVKQEKIEANNQTVDEDGWVTVSKKNSGIFAQKQSVVQKLERKIDNDRSNKQLRNFYTFQIRESKKNDIISLRKKYDRDAQKMEQIKKTKRFKPY